MLHQVAQVAEHVLILFISSEANDQARQHCSELGELCKLSEWVAWAEFVEWAEWVA
jgi:hypothetical protein